MNTFFDVDFTLITWDYRLRPHVKEVFARLTAEGHSVSLWSGMGKRWEVVEQFGLHAWVRDCFEKSCARLSTLRLITLSRSTAKWYFGPSFAPAASMRTRP